MCCNNPVFCRVNAQQQTAQVQPKLLFLGLMTHLNVSLLLCFSSISCDQSLSIQQRTSSTHSQAPQIAFDMIEQTKKQNWVLASLHLVLAVYSTRPKAENNSIGLHSKSPAGAHMLIIHPTGLVLCALDVLTIVDAGPEHPVQSRALFLPWHSFERKWDCYGAAWRFISNTLWQLAGTRQKLSAPCIGTHHSRINHHSGITTMVCSCYGSMHY